MRDKTPRSRSRLNRREVLKLGAATAAIPLLGDLAALAQIPAAARATARWRQYAGDNASTKYSALNKINAENFSRLKVAWTWRSAEEPIVKANHLKTWAWETTPLMIADEAKRQGLSFVGHVSELISAVKASDAGQRSMEHSMGIWQSCSTTEP